MTDEVDFCDCGPTRGILERVLHDLLKNTEAGCVINNLAYAVMYQELASVLFIGASMKYGQGTSEIMKEASLLRAACLKYMVDHNDTISDAIVGYMATKENRSN